MGLWMESTEGSGLLLRRLGFKFSTLIVDSAVFQVFCGYKTIHSCWNRRRTDSRVGMSPHRHLFFRERFVVDVQTVVAILVVYIGVGIVTILLRDSFHRAIELVHGL